jgi:RHS repeat-associated protein
LVNIQNPNNDAVSYEYNENGIRVSSTINGVKTSFLLDANRDYAQVLEEYNSSDVQVAYVYGHDLISQNRSGVKSFYLYDGLGTTKALTDSSGVVTDRYIYDAYGNVLSSTGTTQNNYLYTGEQFDKNLGQYYLRDRYYSHGTGRFTRGDKWEGNSNNPLSLNKYLYANMNPVIFVDPKGLYSSEAQLLGYASEEAIQGVYIEDHPMDSITFGKGVKVANYNLGKPDIVNFSTTPVSYLEIKPFSLTGITAGFLQMTERALELGLFLGFVPDTVWGASPNDFVVEVLGKPLYVFNAAGVLFYSGDGQIEQEIAVLGVITLNQLKSTLIPLAAKSVTAAIRVAAYSIQAVNFSILQSEVTLATYTARYGF